MHQQQPQLSVRLLHSICAASESALLADSSAMRHQEPAANCHGPARPPQSAVQGVDPVGGSNDDHLPPRVQPVHQRQQRGHNTVVDLVLPAVACLHTQRHSRLKDQMDLGVPKLQSCSTKHQPSRYVHLRGQGSHQSREEGEMEGASDKTSALGSLAPVHPLRFPMGEAPTCSAAAMRSADWAASTHTAPEGGAEPNSWGAGHQPPP